jgi:hypothetical protein
MKKWILLLGILSMGFQCGPENDPIENYGEWHVKNTTSRRLMIKPGQFDDQPTAIEPGVTLKFRVQSYSIWKEPVFTDLTSLSPWSGWVDENIAFEVLSDNGTSLAEWRYTGREEAGHQFFNESSWSPVRSAGERDDELKITWTFEIKPEDL